MSGRRVLVVDDNDDHRNWLAIQLTTRGWNVSMARTARAALDLATSLLPNVIVSELVLPDARGMHLPRAVRGVVEHHVKMIALTGVPLEMHIHDSARQAGFDHVHPKPVDVDELHGHMSA